LKTAVLKTARKRTEKGGEEGFPKNGAEAQKR
jgi:hypothetical protein